VLNQSGLFFVPRQWQSATLIKWLKRIHAWSGFWGALFFLLLGTSGFLLNHRAQMKIDTGEPMEVSNVALPVVPGTIPDAEALGTWAQKELKLPVKGQAPRGGGEGAQRKDGGSRRDGAKLEGAVGAPAPTRADEAKFMGREVKPAETWTRAFNMPDARVTVSYVPGANHVTAKREEQGFLNLVKNLHKGTGLPIAWILLIDTIAGALVMMSLTGFLLWSRLHGPRLLAGGLFGGSLIWGFIAFASNLG
jgi:hypothetical protein